MRIIQLIYSQMGTIIKIDHLEFSKNETAGKLRDGVDDFTVWSGSAYSLYLEILN